MANDVAAGFPQVDLTPNTTITVTLDQAGAKITGLAVHGFQDDPADGGTDDGPGPKLNPAYFLGEVT